MTATVRNVLIILALAAVVMLVPGGGNASAAILQVLVIAMLAAIAWFGVRLYREHRVDIYALGDRNRGILYASAGLIALTVTATDRLWSDGPGHGRVGRARGACVLRRLLRVPRLARVLSDAAR